MALQEEFEKQGNFLFRYRGVLPIFILVAGLIATYFNTNLITEADRNCTNLLYYVIGLFGLAIRFYTVGYSARNTSGRNTAEGQIADSVNSTGIYSIIRHPLYVGNFFMWLSLALLSYQITFIIAFVLVYMLYYERIMYAEEQFLRGKFGEAYTSWAAKTPAVLPAFSQWIQCQYSFSWKKALRQEKAGILWMNLIFFIFTSIPYGTTENIFQKNIYGTYILIAGLAYYVIVKLLQKTTKLFD